MTGEMEVVLKELLYNDLVYSYSDYGKYLIEEINEKDSLVLGLTLDKCLYYGISPIFMYLLDNILSEDELEFLYEITLLYRINCLTENDFLDLLDQMCRYKKSINELSKAVLTKLKFVFTNKSIRKNALFAYNEFLLKLNVLPMLDSCSLLRKEKSSVSILPSTLVKSDFNISRNTLKLYLSRLRNIQSEELIFSALTKIVLLYDSDLEVKEVISSLDCNSLSLVQLHELIDNILFKLDSVLALSTHY